MNGKNLASKWAKNGILFLELKQDSWSNVFFFEQAICNTSDKPELFKKYFNYIESVDSNEEPNYDQLIQLFLSQLTEEELNDQNLGILDVDHNQDKIELETQLMGKVINGRFEIKNYRRKEFAVFVHNGSIYLEFLSNQVSSLESGVIFETFDKIQALIWRQTRKSTSNLGLESTIFGLKGSTRTFCIWVLIVSRLSCNFGPSFCI